MKTPLEELKYEIKELSDCGETKTLDALEAIEVAYKAGRIEGRVEGIKESAERVMKTPYTSADNYGGYSLKEPVDILMSAKAMCLSLLTHPSPKEQEK